MAKKNQPRSAPIKKPINHPFLKPKKTAPEVPENPYPNINPEAVLYFKEAAALVKLQEWVQIEELVNKALALEPQWIVALNFKAVSAANHYRADEAETLWLKILEIDPDYSSAYCNLGLFYCNSKRFDEAQKMLERALLFDPKNQDVLLNLTIVYQSQKKIKAAFDQYNLLLKINPKNASAHFNKGKLLSDESDLKSAFESYQQALKYDPFHLGANANFIFSQHYQIPFSPTSAKDYAKRFGDLLSQKNPSYTKWKGDQNPSRTLKIGFVSGNLNTHPVGYFLEPVLKNMHDLNHLDYLNSNKNNQNNEDNPNNQIYENTNNNLFELFAYSNFITEDELTRRIKPFFKKWSYIGAIGDESLAKMIHEDGIDILIDLSGYTGLNRIVAFSYKAAPIQISWLGYFASTGLPEMDYIFGDDYCTPESENHLYTEKIWRLPNSRLILFEPDQLIQTPLPCLNNKNENHPNNDFTFGCFQNIAKINDEVLLTWGKILNQAPNARLRLQSGRINDETERDFLLKRLAKAGISEKQVQLFNGANRKSYFEAHGEVDILLDTFPYPGGTTTNEALWLGVPTITFAGSGMLWRQGEQLLRSAGLSDWVCYSADDYVAKAVSWAKASREKWQELAHLRANLPNQLRAQPAASAQEFAQNWVVALRQIWQIHCQKN